jgi:hypothetical protein
MVPFSHFQVLLNSRVMKRRSLPSSPLTGVKQAVLSASHLVGQSCRFAPTKKPPWPPMLSWKNPHEPNPFPGIQSAHGVLHFLSMSIGIHPWLRIVESSITLALVTPEIKGFKVI